MQPQLAPAAPPAPPTPPTPPAAPGVRITFPGASTSPQAIYQAARARGKELANQLERLQDRRGELSERLKEVGNDADRKGLEQQLTDVDGRITSLNQQIAQSDQQIAQAAGIPGAVVEEKPPVRNGPPDEVFIIPVVFTMFVLFPLTLAWARRLWKRPVTAPAVIPPELTERMTRLEHAVESVAVEVERIGEGQRFVTKLLSDVGTRAKVEAPR